MLQNMATGDQINNAVSIGLAGREVGRIDQGDMFYPLVVRIPESGRTNPETLKILPLRVAEDSVVLGMGELGKWEHKPSVAAITREQAGRREAIMVTVDKRGRGRFCCPGARSDSTSGQAPARLPPRIQRRL